MSVLRQQLLRQQFLRQQAAEDNRLFIENRKKNNRIRDNAQHYSLVHDIISYCLNKHGHLWSKLDLIKTEYYHNNRRFQPEMGEAVLRYQRQHADDIISEINLSVPSSAYDSMADVLLLLAESTFRGDHFVKDFFRFCSQIVTLALHFVAIGQPWRLNAIVEEMYDVYSIFFKRRFAVRGGMHALYTYSIRYCVYGD